jgi:predicted DNA-binding transcriptional regulator AlpA
MSEKYLSASQAIDTLQIPPATFYRYVKEGKIKKHYPSQISKHGMYDAQEIARMISQFKNTSEPKETGETDWIKSSDMGNMYDLEYKEYGDETGNPSIIRKWYERNPYICRVLFNKSDRKDFWGAINMLPLEEETIYKLLRGEIKDIDLDPQRDILTYEAPGAYNFYVASIIIDRTKRQHFQLLMNSLFHFWCDQAPERRIGKIYGRIVTEHGELMAKKLFFSPTPYISESAFMLDMSRPNPSRIIQSFQYCVEAREEENETTVWEN